MIKTISVIIPTLNEEKYLPHLIRDLAKQTSLPLEAVIVDGGSTDKTVEIIKSIQRSSPLSIVLIQTNKKNPGFQRNLGSEKASGDIIAFFDADMRIPSPNFFENIQKCFGDYDAVIPWLHISRREEVFSDRVASLVIRITMALPRLFGFYPFRGTLLVSRIAFHRCHGFSENKIVGEDVDLGLRLSRHGKMMMSREEVIECPRRFRKLGYVRVFSSWIWNGVVGFFSGSSPERIWKEVR